MAKPLRVLVVDDSMITVQAITRVLEADPALSVVGRALRGDRAVELVERLCPDVITMDINMPGMDGIDATRAIVGRFGTPIVIVSAFASARGVAQQTLQALQSGAVDTVQKPSGEIGLDIDLVSAELIAKVKAASRAKPATKARVAPSAPVRVDTRVSNEANTLPWSRVVPAALHAIGIGISTGGPSTLDTFVPSFPSDFPVPLVMVIHMSSAFIPILADKLDATSRLKVRVARDTARLSPGELWIGPADVHLEVTQDLRIRLSPGRPVSGCIPSVDVLFESMARSLGSKALGLVMTGMGRDGTRGLRAMRETGCVTAAQDATSCVVYGMPRSAKESGAAAFEVPLAHTVEFLTRAASGR